ncbi:MAG: beta-ketoacyl-ACP synthase II [Lentisphaerae bacterium]|jgi:3-oxoacyl-[acyl-carrier-protein] synthase II|nr:beta-ketoacyl-ACP synthase II [Lentisphaerota bacterium]
MQRRVVITGLGTVNPVGNDVASFWEGIREGRSGVGRITRVDASALEVKIAAEVKGFNPDQWMDAKAARKMALFSQYAVAATAQALKDAGLDRESIDPFRTGIYIGNGIGGYEVIEESMGKYFAQGPRRILPLTVPEIISNEAAGNIAMAFGIKGFALTSVTACASGTDALGAALDMLRAGRCDVCVSGGTESAITGFGLGGFQIIRALSTKYNDTPEKASRPFDRDRDGFIMGEGAGILVLETLEHAQARGARIYAELAGYGVSCDAYHLTAPDPEGGGGARAITLALQDAGVAPDAVQYYNAHGTSTPLNDPLETKMIKRAFGDHARRLKVSSTKSMTGHLIAAAGAVEAIVCTLAIRDGFFPPTINLDHQDIEGGCDLDYVPNTGVEGEIDVAVSGSLGFGGHNAVVVIRKCRT